MESQEQNGQSSAEKEKRFIQTCQNQIEQVLEITDRDFDKYPFQVLCQFPESKCHP
jgi:hypothetical protein